MDNQGHPPVKAAVPPQTQLLCAELRPEHCIPNSSRLLVKDKLTDHAAGVKKQVKKIQLLFHSLYPASCSALLPPCFGNKLRWQNAAFFKETVCRHCMAEVSLFIRDYDGVFHSFKKMLIALLSSRFFQTFTRTQWKIILLNVLKLSHTSFSIIKAAFSAEICWTNEN